MRNRLPKWFQQEIPDVDVFKRLGLLSEFKINTICQQARCPNITACFKDSKLTFMILGNTCTRNCSFCAVSKLEPVAVDENESYRVAEIVKSLGLRYVVITSVTRDDLSDGGAGHFARTIKAICAINKDIKIEVLIPDFQGSLMSLKCVLGAQPDIIAHNLETVRRLYPELRPQAGYDLSLRILKSIKEYKVDLITKSSIMLGLGESRGEVFEAMCDLRKSNCDILTLGQYLAPSSSHYPVKEFINLEQFHKYSDIGLSLGFRQVLSGPLVRSSYQAEHIYKLVTR